MGDVDAVGEDEGKTNEGDDYNARNSDEHFPDKAIVCTTFSIASFVEILC